MKKYLCKILIVFTFFVCIINSFPNQVKAIDKYIINSSIKISDEMDATGGGGGSTSSGNSGKIDTGSYKPEITNNTKANSMIGKIFGALQIIGMIAIVLSIALVGFNTMLGSAEEKAQGKGKAIGILFGAIMITAVSTIAKLIISAVE